ncbi:MAG: pyruvate, phosphate dikinase [Gemmatimonadetes bacterium]|nr:pyruvate, phosphate dikinase [Gemmatimonadota bacterium]
MSERWVYFFGNGEADGSRHDKDLLGGKGANLAEMVRVGVPVPPGFTITTDASRHYMAERSFPPGLEEQSRAALTRIEEGTARTFGGGDDPLLLSVRSGAAVSMPGMMDTILNLGLNDATVEALARGADDARFAWDSYRRFVQMYGNVVLGVPNAAFEELLRERRDARGVEDDTGLTADDLRALVPEYKEMIAERTGVTFPEEPEEQLWGAVRAVFDSWDNDRAVAYRRHEGIPDDFGTAVTVMAMVYGNMGETSGTGVAFTRDPSTGEKRFFGEFLLNAQGEDVVSGIRTPVSISQMADLLPDAYADLLDIQERLERHYRDMQDLEFTVERGRLYLLQTRSGKRAAAAALRIAAEMVDEGLIDTTEAVLRIDPEDLERQLHSALDPNADPTVLATGLPASPGAASGRVVFDPDEAVRRSEAGEAVIMVRAETSPDDFAGMAAARAIVTARGGMTSHAAVVARGMGKPCVVGARDLEIAREGRSFKAAGHTVAAGDWVTIDGASGRLLLGRVPTVEPELTEHFHRVMGWADDARRLGVRANADTPEDARQARAFGAEGIGLCRTEHMFHGDDRVRAVREMILADDGESRRRALERILPMQREDFEGIFQAMDGYPVTIRLLDPPLHEFLPHDGEEMDELAWATGRRVEEIRAAVERHRESNPMLGHRGVRLAISVPEIAEMQAQAIFEAAVAAAADGVDVQPEIMVPLVATVEELRVQDRLIRDVATRVFEEAGREVPYMVGTMIELPRAALTADRIAEVAEFFSFGTNDLTQTTFGISRDDAASFLPRYIEQGILQDDPFQVLDREGVGQLVTLGTRKGRSTRSDLKVGICGEHGGEPSSVEFCHHAGLDYVSCSPFRVPVARLAAARAALEEAGNAEEAEEDGVDPGTPAEPSLESVA